MKDMFSSYYSLGEEDFKKLFEEGIVVVDANVLLSLYRYSIETSDELLRLLKSFDSQLWIPHQVAFEFHKNRLNVMAKEIDSINDIVEKMEWIKKSIKDHLDKKTRTKVIKSLDGLIEMINKAPNRPLDPLLDDTIKTKITNLFEGKVGEEFSSDELSKIKTEGEVRYKNKTPPGFKDKNKEENCFGDLILWKQLIKKAQQEKKGIVLVTGDKKADWWYQFQGKTLCPRPELRDEIKEEAGVLFHMYSTESFMKHASQHNKMTMKTKAIDEIRERKSRDKLNEAKGIFDGLLKSVPDGFGLNTAFAKQKVALALGGADFNRVSSAEQEWRGLNSALVAQQEQQRIALALGGVDFSSVSSAEQEWRRAAKLASSGLGLNSALVAQQEQQRIARLAKGEDGENEESKEQK